MAVMEVSAKKQSTGPSFTIEGDPLIMSVVFSVNNNPIRIVHRTEETPYASVSFLTKSAEANAALRAILEKEGIYTESLSGFVQCVQLKDPTQLERVMVAREWPGMVKHTILEEAEEQNMARAAHMKESSQTQTQPTGRE